MIDLLGQKEIDDALSEEWQFYLRFLLAGASGHLIFCVRNQLHNLQAPKMPQNWRLSGVFQKTWCVELEEFSWKEID